MIFMELAPSFEVIAQSPLHFAIGFLHVETKMEFVENLHYGYSCLPNTRRGWNNGIGWKIPSELINVGDGINVLDGKFM